MTLGNLLFLTKLSFGYAVGAPANFTVVKNGIKLFKELARKSSSRIISVAKGIAICDLGQVMLTNGVRTRIVIVRRISRKKTDGIWKVNTYYYGISSNLKLSARQLYRFYFIIRDSASKPDSGN